MNKLVDIEITLSENMPDDKRKELVDAIRSLYLSKFPTYLFTLVGPRSQADAQAYLAAQSELLMDDDIWLVCSVCQQQGVFKGDSSCALCGEPQTKSI